MRTYTVVAGDTLYGIAYRFGVPRADLVAANPQITNVNLITPGQIIFVPSMGVAPPGGTDVASSGMNKVAVGGALVLGLGLLWLFFKDAPRKNPRRSQKGKGKGKGKLKRMSAFQYARAHIKPTHVLTAMQVGSALARRYR